MKTKLFGTQTGMTASELILGTAMFGNRSGYTAPARLYRVCKNYYNLVQPHDAPVPIAIEELSGRAVARVKKDYWILCRFNMFATRCNRAAAVVGVAL